MTAVQINVNAKMIVTELRHAYRKTKVKTAYVKTEDSKTSYARLLYAAVGYIRKQTLMVHMIL